MIFYDELSPAYNLPSLEQAPPPNALSIHSKLTLDQLNPCQYEQVIQFPCQNHNEQ